VPVDSEHSAILQCIAGRPSSEVRRLVLTASGGPFRSWTAEQLQRATLADALQHPTWQMGRKITVDSATLANKALEVIEAHFLFDVPYDRIEVVVHPQSVVHSFVEFVDGSVLAQLGVPSMELPVLYALTHPDRVADTGVPPFDPVEQSPLSFEPVRRQDFPALDLGMQAGRAGGAAPAVFNAATEQAGALFLDGAIRFGDGSAMRRAGRATPFSPPTRRLGGSCRSSFDASNSRPDHRLRARDLRPRAGTLHRREAHGGVRPSLLHRLRTGALSPSPR
jgi:1-deoxy-D-xylulose-5-phosphate reductoisomerase